jgi:hypothetical protein
MGSGAVIAAVLVFALGAAHSYLGERYILIRLFRRQDLPHLFGSDVFTKHTLRFAWHLTTVAWYGLGIVILQVAAHAAASVLGTTIALTSLVSGVVAFVGSRGRHLSWPLFLVIAVLVWYATR